MYIEKGVKTVLAAYPNICSYRKFKDKNQDDPVPANKVTKLSDWLTLGVDAGFAWTVDFNGSIFYIEPISPSQNWREEVHANFVAHFMELYRNYESIDPDTFLKYALPEGFKISGPFSVSEYLETATPIPETDFKDSDYHPDKEYHENTNEWYIQHPHEKMNKLLESAGVPRKCGARTIVTRTRAYRLFCNDFRNCPRCRNWRVKTYLKKVANAVLLSMQSFYSVLVEDHAKVTRRLREAGVPYVVFPIEEGDYVLFLTPGLLALKDQLEELNPKLVPYQMLPELMEHLIMTPEKRRIRFSKNFPLHELEQDKLGKSLRGKRTAAAKEQQDKYSKFGTFIIDADIHQVWAEFTKYYHFPNLGKDVDSADLSYFTDEEWAKAVVDLCTKYKAWIYGESQFYDADPWIVKLKLKFILEPAA